MINILAISTMTLEEVQDARKKISVSTADGETKSALYKACDEREKAVDRSAALVERCDEL